MLNTLLIGIVHGGTYALMAVGIALIFGVANIINFAHGSVFAIGGMTGWFLITHSQLPLWLVLVAVVALTSIIGIIVNNIAVQPFRKAPHIVALLATYAVSIVLDNSAQLIFGPNTVSYPSLLSTGNFSIGSFRFGTLEIVLLVVPAVAVALLAAMLRWTTYGRAIRATAQDAEAAQMMGIPARRVQNVVFAIASALGGIAGVLVGMYDTAMTPLSGGIAMLTAFTAATLGGLSSLSGAIGGSIILGIVEAFGVAWWGDGVSNLLIFGILILTLWIRPSGIFTSRRTVSLPTEPLTGSYFSGGRPIRMRWWQVGVVLVVGLVIVPAVANGYWLTVGTQVVIYAMLGLSLVLLSGLAGQLSLGQVGPFAIGAYALALLTTKAHWDFLPALLIGALIAALLSGLIMAPSWKLSGHYIGVATLGVGAVTVAAILNLGGITNGPLGIHSIPAPTVFGLTLADSRSLYLLDAIMLVLALVVVTVIERSSLGMIFRAVGQDQVALRALGMHPSYYKSLAFVIGAFIAGIAGGLLAAQYSYIDPTVFTTDISVLALTIIVLGGMNSPFGAVIGAVLFVAGPEILRLADTWRLLMYGAALLLLIWFRPRGLWTRKAS